MKSVKESSEDGKGFSGDRSIVLSLLGSIHQGFGSMQDLDLGFPIEGYSFTVPEEFVSSHDVALKIRPQKAVLRTCVLRLNQASSVLCGGGSPFDLTAHQLLTGGPFAFSGRLSIRRRR